MTKKAATGHALDDPFPKKIGIIGFQLDDIRCLESEAQNTELSLEGSIYFMTSIGVFKAVFRF